MKKLTLLLLIVLIAVSCTLFDPPEADIDNIEFVQKILDGYWVVSIAFEDDGTAWCGTLGGYSSGLLRYKDGQVDVFNAENSIINDSTTIWDLDVDSQGRVWICNDGLVCYEDGNFIRYDSSNSLIPQNSARSVEIDSDDKIWVTSRRSGGDGGLISLENDEFSVFTTENSDLPSETINDIQIDHENNIWLLYFDKITKFDGNVWKSFTPTQLGFTARMLTEFDINSEDEICGIIDYSFSSALYPSIGKPVLYKFNGLSSKIARGDSTSYFSRIFVDSEDIIWCAGYGGIRAYNSDNLKVFTEFDLNHSSFTIAESPDGEIWISGGGGVHIYQK